MTIKCKWCEAEVSDGSDEILAKERWGWTLAADIGLGVDDRGRGVPGFWYACFECSDTEFKDAFKAARINS